MASEPLRYLASPAMRQARMVLGFSGWMDGGDVSTGTVGFLAEQLRAQPLAELDSEDFYIHSLPGSMEIAALFRPHARIEDGLVSEFKRPGNTFYFCQQHNLILLLGREPHLRWTEYVECLLSLAGRFEVSMVYFVGSVAGLVPHTREPRFYASVSEESLRPMFQKMAVRFTNYEGPASLCTYLMHLCPQRGLKMANLVGEIPAYVQGRNFRCIKAAAQRLAGILDIPLNLDELRVLADQSEDQLNRVVRKHPELAQRVRKLEEDYDNDVFDTQMGDLKDWLQQQGIRLD